MPTKRAILAELTRDELRTRLDHYELEVEDRRVNAQLVAALVHSRRASLDEILPALSLDRLKELCRAFDRDDLRSKEGGSRRAPHGSNRSKTRRAETTPAPRERAAEHDVAAGAQRSPALGVGPSLRREDN